MSIKFFDFSKVDSVIINLDGVLTTTTQNALSNWLNAGQDLCIPEWDVVWMFYKCYGTSADHTKCILSEYNVDLQEFLSTVHKHSECEHIELNAHAMELLKSLKDKSVNIIVTTSLSNPEDVLKKLKITKFISNIMDIDETPDIYTIFMSKKNINPQHTIIIEDPPHMIEASLNSEALAVIAVENLQKHSSYTENQRVVTTKDLTEIIRLIGAEND